MPRRNDRASVAALVVMLLAPVMTRAAGPVPGAMAPPIVASRWVRGAPIAEYKRGSVYVIDLWAMWCVPCRAAMPQLLALETKFAGKATFAAVDVWEMDITRMPKFLEKNGSVMSANIALDSIPAGKEANEGLTALGFLGASAQITIPRTYVIDQSGRIAWIGHPNELEEPLSAVVKGTWDIPAFAAEYARTLAGPDSTSAQK